MRGTATRTRGPSRRPSRRPSISDHGLTRHPPEVAEPGVETVLDHDVDQRRVASGHRVGVEREPHHARLRSRRRPGRNGGRWSEAVASRQHGEIDEGEGGESGHGYRHGSAPTVRLQSARSNPTPRASGGASGGSPGRSGARGRGISGLRPHSFHQVSATRNQNLSVRRRLAPEATAPTRRCRARGYAAGTRATVLRRSSTNSSSATLRTSSAVTAMTSCSASSRDT